MMLTQTQKDLLYPLTKHEKYGKLLIDAMKTWEIAKPKKWDFGLDVINNEWQLNENKHCCLLGAALANKNKNRESLYVTVTEVFLISLKESWDLSDGFDTQNANLSEANQFANKVSSIVFDS